MSSDTIPVPRFEGRMEKGITFMSVWNKVTGQGSTSLLIQNLSLTNLRKSFGIIRIRQSRTSVYLISAFHVGKTMRIWKTNQAVPGIYIKRIGLRSKSSTNGTERRNKKRTRSRYGVTTKFRVFHRRHRVLGIIIAQKSDLSTPKAKKSKERLR